MLRHLIAHERTVSQLVSPVGETTARSPPHVCFPTHKRDSRDSLGSVLSETHLVQPLPSRAVSN